MSRKFEAPWRDVAYLIVEDVGGSTSSRMLGARRRVIYALFFVGRGVSPSPIILCIKKPRSDPDPRVASGSFRDPTGRVGSGLSAQLICGFAVTRREWMWTQGLPCGGWEAVKPILFVAEALTRLECRSAK